MLLGDTGLEPSIPSGCADNDLGKPEKQGGAESGAIKAETPPDDPDLASVVTAWPTLPDHIRSTILTLVKNSRQEERGA
jgi:hypothetical protein